MKTRFFLPAAVPLLVLLPACEKAPPPKSAAPPLVEVTTIEPTDLPVYREIVATLQGTVNTALKPKVQGYLLTQEYDDGSAVEKGQPLFTIDPDPFEIAVQKAAADVDQAKAELVKARLEVERSRELIKADAISQKQLDNAVQARQAAEAQVKAAEANLANAKLNLGFCRVVSPIAGVAGKAQADLGDLVGPGTTLATISSLDPIQAVFHIPEQAYFDRSKDLQKALSVPVDRRPANLELILANGDTFPHRGRLRFIDRQIEEGTGTIGVYALFPNPGNVLRPGQYAKVRGRVDTVENALLVPQRAVKETQGMFSVFTVKEDGTVGSVPVELGETQGSRAVVASGLKAGDTIVVEGIQKIRSGSSVRTKPWKGDTADDGGAAGPSADGNGSGDHGASATPKND